MPTDVALFVSPYCDPCIAASKALRLALDDLVSAGVIRYRECDVLQHLDRAVMLRVTNTPALAVNDRLVPVRSWQVERLRQALLDCIDNLET